MARTPEDDFGGQSGASAAHQKIQLSVDGQEIINLPSADFVKNSDILREGQDLVLEGADGTVIVIEGYFNADPAPLLQAPDGQALSPQLVNSFVHHAGPAQYARAGTLSDESPVGAINEVSGQATVTRTDGTKENITVGTPIFEGDVIETEGSGAVNIIFIDETSLSVSENAKLAIDEYVFDPSSQSGTTDVSVLRGLFVFTSGLIGRDDPDDVNIDTPMGSIGIRGTVIVGNADTGEVTVMEGAIVLRGFNGNEVTLAQQFETAKFSPDNGDVTYLGKSDPGQFADNYSTLKPVAPNLFNGMADNGQTGDNANDPATNAQQGDDGAAASGDASTQDAGSDQSGTTNTDGQQDTTTTQAQPSATDDSSTADTNTDTSASDTNTTDPATTDTSTSTDTSFDGGSDSGFGDSTTTTTSSSPTSTSTSGTTSPTDSGTTSGSGTTGTTSGGTTDSTATQPPPSVTGGTGGTGGTAPSPTITSTTLGINENSGTGSAAGTVATTNMNSPIFAETGNGSGAALFDIDAAGNVTVQAGASLDYETTNSYTYEVSATDANGTVTKMLNIQIGDLDDVAPTLTNSGVTLDEGGFLNLTTGSHLNATDPDTAPSDIIFTISSTPANGALALSGTPLTIGGTFTLQDIIDSKVRYTHDGSETTADSFGFDVTDGVNGGPSGQTFSIAVNAVNDAPTSSNDTAATSEDTPIVLTSSDFGTYNDAEGDAFTNIKITNLPADGTVEYYDGASWNAVSVNDVISVTDIDASKLRFVPDANENGAGYATIGFKVGDSTDFSDSTYTLTIDVTAVDDAPTLDTSTGVQGSDGLQEGGQVVLTTAMLEASDVDTADAGITYQNFTGLTNGHIALSATPGTPITSFTQQQLIDGDVVYVHDGSNTTSDTFNFDITDGTNTTSGQSIGIVINAIDGAPIFTATGPFTLDENSTGTAGDVDANDGDGGVADSGITYSIIGGNTDVDGDGNAAFSIDAAGVISVNDSDDLDYETNPTFNLTVRASDGTNMTDAAVTINLNDIDDNDNILGDALNNVLDGGIGDDLISAGDGDDIITINDNDGSDTIDGGSGNDTYDASGTVNDRTYNLGDGASDTVVDGGETDNVQNVETFSAGSGSDTFNISNNNFGYTLDGGTGTDTLDYSALNNGNTIDFDFTTGVATLNGGTVHNFNGFETVTGSQGADNFIVADGDGNMTLDGHSGEDTYNGANLASAMNATLSGGALTVSTGSDTDTLIGFEKISGSANDDTFTVDAIIPAFSFDGAGGSLDAFHVTGLNGTVFDLNGAGSATVTSGGNSNTLTNIEALYGSAGAGNDDTFIVSSVNANQTVDGGTDGNDTIDFSSVSWVQIDLAAGDATIALGTVSFSNIETIIGTTGAGVDEISFVNAANGVDIDLSANAIYDDGNANSYTISEFEDIRGSSFADIITGDSGDNSIWGEGGDDTIAGGAGADSLDGGAGIDTADYSASVAAVNVDLAAGTGTGGDAEGDTLFDIENVTGSNFNDTLTGNASDNTLDGGTGDDILIGGAGNDTLIGGAGIDTVDYIGAASGVTADISAGTVSIDGDGGSDTLSGIEIFKGSNFNDTINTDGTGYFEIYGGDGADIFNINTSPFDMVADGTSKKITGGNSVNDIDTLNFTSSGTITLNPDGVEDIITGVETYNFQNSMTNNVNINLQNFMLNSNDGALLTIQIDDSDTLDLDFTALSGSWGVQSTGGSWVEYTDGARTIRVEDGGGTGIASMTVRGAAPGVVGLDLNALGGTDGFKITDNLNEGFGYSVAAIGDADGDGFDDLAFTKQGNAPGDGRVFILNGQAGGFTSDTLPNLTGTTITEQIGFFSGNGATTDMTLGGYGDFNGDGVLDYVIGAPSADTGGAANMTGNAQIVDGSTGNVLLQLDGGILAFGDELGKSVSFIGDINGDGYDDVLVGAPSMGGSNEGGAFILFGEPSGAVTQNVGAFNDGTALKTYETNVGAGATDSAIIHTGGARILATVSTTGLKLFDVSTPDTPVAQGTWDSGLNATAVTLAYDPGTGKTYAFVASGDGAGNDNLSRLDISDPTNPTGEFSFNDNAGELNNVTSIAVDFKSGIGVAVSPDTDNGGTTGSITVFDPSAPGTRVYLSHGALSDASDVVLNSGFAYVATPAGIQTIDMTPTTGNPSASSSNPLIGTFDALTNVTDIAIEDGHLFAVTNDGVNSKLAVFDVSSDPSNPSLLSNYVSANLAGVMDVYIEHDMAIMVVDKGATADIVMVNIADPSSPVLANTITNVAFSDVQSIVAADGFAYVLDATNANNLQTIDMDPAGMVINGGTANGLAGTNVSAAGDFNNDGFEDFVISMPGSDSVAVIFGGERGFDLSNNATFMEISGVPDADEDIPLFNAGDFDGDGISDIAIAGDNEIRIFLGNESYNKTTNKTFGQHDLQITAAAGSEIIGAGAVNDFNGDGWDDFAVAIRDTSGDGDMVNVYVVYGGSTGTLDNSTLGAGLNDETNAFLMTYQIPGAGTDNDVNNFDFQISAAGDINGDGFADMVLTTPGLDTNIDGSNDGADGEAMIIFGKPSYDPAYIGDNSANVISGQGGVADYILGEGGDDTIVAGDWGQTLVGGLGNDILDDGGTDTQTLLGGAGNDTMNISRDDFLKIDGGSGFDTIKFLGGADSVLDLSNLGSEAVKNIEAVDYNDGTAQTVVLGMDDVFEMMSGAEGTAKINGDANDILAIELPDFDGPSGILTDNDWVSMQAGEGHLHEFNARITDPAGNTNYYGFDHNGQQLWISKALIDSGQVVLGSNIVTDGSTDDADGANNNLQASSAEQTLIGNNGINIFDDGAQNDVSMFGFGGDDTFTLNSGNFDVINGGVGNDTLIITVNLDLRDFNGHELSGIETLNINKAGGGTLTLSKQNIYSLLESSDGGVLTIEALDNANDSLIIDNMTSGGETAAAGATAIATALGGTHSGSDANYHYFTIGGNTLQIDANLITSNNVDVI